MRGNGSAVGAGLVWVVGSCESTGRAPAFICLLSALEHRLSVRGGRRLPWWSRNLPGSAGVTLGMVGEREQELLSKSTGAGDAKVAELEQAGQGSFSAEVEKGRVWALGVRPSTRGL